MQCAWAGKCAKSRKLVIFHCLYTVKHERKLCQCVVIASCGLPQTPLCGREASDFDFHFPVLILYQ